MTIDEFDKSKFFFNMSAKVSGKWYNLISCDFEVRTIIVDDGSELDIKCEHIEELEEMK